jgi:hypothetical protein
MLFRDLLAGLVASAGADCLHYYAPSNARSLTGPHRRAIANVGSSYADRSRRDGTS